MLIFIEILAFIGILNTLYLSYHSITGAPVRCIFFPPEQCHKVQFSSYSRLVAGIPNSFMGLSFYAAIFVFTILFDRGIWPFWPAQLVIAIGFLFSVFFTYVQARVLHAFCTWCVLSAIDFVFLAVIGFFLVY